MGFQASPLFIYETPNNHEKVPLKISKRVPKPRLPGMITIWKIQCISNPLEICSEEQEESDRFVG